MKHQFKVNDPVTWVRASGDREDATVIDVGESAVRIQVLAPYSTYWVSPGDLEPRLPPGSARYTSPVIVEQQLGDLIDHLSEAWKARAGSCRIRFTETPGGLKVEVLPPWTEG